MLEIVQQFSIMLYMEVTTLPPISLNFLINIVMKLSLPWRDTCFHSGFRRGSSEQRGGIRGG